ncbi:MAG: M28 family peptidase, partial [Acidobacteria bacterium]|nr:M28 family peptidase [Acidobacteriota bacterium]
MNRIAALSLAAALLPLAGAAAEEPVDWEMASRIREEGFHGSQVMDTLTQLTDVIGPRLTGSPQMKQANDWTRQQLEDWGLVNAHLEAFDFGRGWSFDSASVQMVAPVHVPLLALPQAWTRGTKGKVKGDVVRIKVESEDDLEKYRGKLKGKVVLIEDTTPDFRPPGRPSPEDATRRYSEEQLDEISVFEIPGDGRGDWRRRFRGRRQLQKKIQEFLIEEKALATLEKSSRKNGIVRVARGGSYEADDPKAVTGLQVGAEHFQRIERFLDADRTVTLEIEVDARFHEDSKEAYNTIAEIPGTDPAGEIVMAGAHMDSWHGGTGATDNAAGCAVMMEAVRILKALGVQP